jgi:oligoribonuclease NrnB/cAMP/cGMP phosphodiesterase (DHH superfamily)
MVLGDRAVYTAVRHGEAPPPVRANAHLAIVDFAYPREQLLAIARSVSKVIVLDHHRSAELDLAGLDFAVFAMEKSGARMAWEFWHPNEPFPEVFALIEDRDLWRWALPDSREVGLALAQEPFEFERWAALNLEELRTMGHMLMGFQASLISRTLSKAHWIMLGGYRVPACNSCLFQSEVGDELCLKYPDAPFAAVYYNKGDSIAWSLRSIGEFDVSRVASSFGGGGHRNAAGFSSRADSGITSEAVLPTT